MRNPSSSLLVGLFSALTIAAALAPSTAARAADRPVLSLSGASFRPLPLALAPALAAPEADRAALAELEGTLRQDLEVCGLFELLEPKSFLAPKNEGVKPQEIKFPRWLDVGAEALVKLSVDGAEPMGVELFLYSVVTGKQELSKRYSEPRSLASLLAHTIADDIFTFYTGEAGAFRTRIAFVRKVGENKQVFTSSWDGKGAAQLTRGAINILPAWNPEGTAIGFMSYRSGSPDLYLQPLGSEKATPLVHRASGLVTGLAFSRDGRKIAYSMSEADGSSQLWLADRDGSGARKLTDGFALNTSPSFSPDGKQLAFVSNRAGNPQIYIMGVEGGAAKRITFQGNYNQTPDWSPRGDLIAFTARDERNVFDIFTVNPTTNEIVRLTQDQGNNEEPSFSPNGRLLIFSSTRTGKSQLFVMSADGNAQRQITREAVDSFTPVWGPSSK